MISLAKRKPKKGYAVLMGDTEHTLAPYTRSGAAASLGKETTIEGAALLELSRTGARLSLCFPPRSIYSDVGEFSCVSREATSAHIRSTVDKIGLFREDYRIAFTKIQDIDKLKARYSYLAVPNSELARIDLIDEDEAAVDVFCPIEASLASALSTVATGMAILVYQDARFIRIIAANDGIVYYLITINAAESFDATADTVSGVREMTSLLQASYQQKVSTVYLAGTGDIGAEELARHSVDAVPLPLGNDGDAASAVLMGTAMLPRYDFTTERLRKTASLIASSKASMAVSLLTILLALVFFALGWSNASTNRDLQKKITDANLKNAQELRFLEEEYALISKDLDLSTINTLVETYKDFQAEPRLHAILDTISAQVPQHVFLTRIEVKRPPAPQDP
ncbi:MAG TPA: hypothetical protein PLR71_14885, partial [Deltaproteobacteria bacterium]|nr:hypothetical protein [Deltaproteobacteria bacterium]